jgi:hypothetical protein
MSITDTEIKRAKPEQKPYSMSDSGGLHLVISPAGGKLWRWKYRFEGKEKLMALGKYPQVPLAMARERHSEGRRLLATGVDPMAQRKAVKTAERVASENSFASVAAQWFEHWQDGKVHAMLIRLSGAWPLTFCLVSVPVQSPRLRLQKSSPWPKP